MTIDELITKLEAADGPSRELDAEIKLAIAAFMISDGCSADAVEAVCGKLCDEPPPFMGSVDRALLAVPEGWEASSSGPSYNSRTGMTDQYFSLVRGQSQTDAPDPGGACHHQARATALVIAALRARKAKD